MLKSVVCLTAEMGRSKRKKEAMFAEMRDRTLWLEGLLLTEQAPDW